MASLEGVEFLFFLPLDPLGRFFPEMRELRRDELIFSIVVHGKGTGTQ